VEIFIFSGGVRGGAPAALFIFFDGGGVGPLLTLGGKVVAKLIDSFFLLPRA
jgi:predicted PurR-regulated permease PerM